MSTENALKEKFVLTITANSFTSTDPRFDINSKLRRLLSDVRCEI